MNHSSKVVSSWRLPNRTTMWPIPRYSSSEIADFTRVLPDQSTQTNSSSNNGSEGCSGCETERRGNGKIYLTAIQRVEPALEI